MGDTDVTTTGVNNDITKICANHLCYRATDHASDLHSATAYDMDCVAPILGRYLTIQRYAGNLEHKSLGISEIDVTTYCTEPAASEDVCPMLSGDSDECDLASTAPSIARDIKYKQQLFLSGSFFLPFPVFYEGCYTLSTSLPTDIGYDAANNPINCAERCLASNPAYNYAAVRATHYCHCGTSFSGDMVLAYLCDEPCPGHDLWWRWPCGWAGYGAIYRINKEAFRKPTKIADKSGMVATASTVTTLSHLQDLASPAHLLDGDANNGFRTDENEAFAWIQVCKLANNFSLHKLKKKNNFVVLLCAGRSALLS